MSIEEASGQYASVSSKLEARISELHSTPTATQAPEGANARQNLLDLGDLLAHDATKFHFLFDSGDVSGKARHSEKDAAGMLQLCEPNVDKFYAWCTAVGSESKAIQREVAQLGGDVLAAFKAMLDVIVALKFKGPLQPEVCGRVMKTADALKKKLPKDEAAAVQGQVFRDAACVKSVHQDLEAVLADQQPQPEMDAVDKTAVDMEHMQVAANDSTSRFTDLMNMDVSLEGDEIQVVQASIEMIQSCLSLQKATCRVLIGIRPDTDTLVNDESGSLEEVAEGCACATRALEDLGALCVLDQSECRENAELALAGMRKIAEGLSKLTQHVSTPHSIHEHVASTAALVIAAQTALEKIP